MVPELVVLALEYYRAPLRYRHLADPNRGLPQQFGRLVSELGTALSPQNRDATAHTLGVHPKELERATNFFLRDVLLTPGADHYRVLGLSQHDSPLEDIRQHYQLLVAIFHPDRADGEDADRNAIHTARLNEAYSTLRDPEQRARYDEKKPRRQSTATNAIDDRELFRPRSPIEPFSGAKTSRTVNRFRGRMWVVAMLSAAALVLTAFLLIRPSPQPVLSASQDARDRSPRPPAYFVLPGAEVAPLVPPPADPTSTRALESVVESQARPTVISPGASPPEETIRSADSGKDPTPPSRDEIRIAALRGPVDIPPQGIAEHAATKNQSSKRSPDAGQAIETVPLPEEKVPLAEEAPAKASEPRAASTREGSAGPAVPHRNVKEPQPPPATKPAPESRKEDTKTAKQSASDAKSTDNAVGKAGKDTQAPRDDKATANPAAAPPGPTPSPPSEVDQSEKATAAKLPEQHRPPADPKTAPRPNPTDVIDRLVRTYESGDLDGFVRLFTPDARVNDGRGTAFIRADYADLFARTPERRLVIQDLSLRQSANGKVTATGAIKVSTKPRRGSRWRYGSGTITFELVPTANGYRISKMIHQLK